MKQLCLKTLTEVELNADNSCPNCDYNWTSKEAFTQNLKDKGLAFGWYNDEFITRV